MYAINLDMGLDEGENLSTVKELALQFGVNVEDTGKASPNKLPIYRFKANSLGSLSQFLLHYSSGDEKTTRDLIGEYLEVV
jgi:hypothetical protein